jgi:hypothetical protein
MSTFFTFHAFFGTIQIWFSPHALVWVLWLVRVSGVLFIDATSLFRAFCYV